MTIVNGEFDADDTERILTVLVNSAERAFGEKLDPDEASVIRAFYLPVAQYLAQQQDDIAQVLQSTQIDNAEGEALDLLASLIGVDRREATGATTRLQFQRNNRTTSNYTVPAGSRVQTDETDPLYFETQKPVQLKFVEGFESGGLGEYTGDTASFSAQGTTVYTGSYALEGAAASGKIIDADETITRGSVMHVRQYLNADAVAGTLFAVQDVNNYYSVVLDEPADEVRLEKTSDGTTTTVGSAAATLPAAEWLDIKIDWENEGVTNVVVDNASGTEIENTTFDDGDDYLDTGGIGFASYDTAATKYWDDYTMSAVGAPAKATTTGVETNVGALTITVPTQDITGVDSYTNPIGATGGRDREEDPEYRERAKTELSEGMHASLPAIISQLSQVPDVRSVSIIDNDSNTTDADNRPGHSFEAIVEAPESAYEDVAKKILETKAAGDTSVGGYDGTAVTVTLELVNGQSKDITFSTPTDVQIYVDCNLTKTDTYAGDEAVQDSIVQYIGGVLNAGGTIGGQLSAGDDVVYNKIVGAVMDVEGVNDISNLEIGTSSSPTGTSNISISSSDAATANATDTSLSVTSSDV